VSRDGGGVEPRRRGVDREAAEDVEAALDKVEGADEDEAAGGDGAEDVGALQRVLEQVQADGGKVAREGADEGDDGGRGELDVEDAGGERWRFEDLIADAGEGGGRGCGNGEIAVVYREGNFRRGDGLWCQIEELWELTHNTGKAVGWCERVCKRRCEIGSLGKPLALSANN
jgi:hypothetical protein